MNAANITNKDMAELMIYDRRMAKAGLRLGLRPHPVDYWLVHDEQIVQVLPSAGVPGDYHYWNKGKAAERHRQGHVPGHIYEMVINTNPSICYLSNTNTIPMQLNVMAHAVWGHVDFFANNVLFQDTQPATVLARFKLGRNKLKELVESPEWGWDRVEYFMDAIHAIENYCGWLPDLAGTLTEKEVRANLKEEAVELSGRLLVEGEVSSNVRQQLLDRINVIETQLKRYPVIPTDDLLGFLMDPDNTPGLPDEMHTMLSIVRDRARYFQPQVRTKIMNEGWASYWQRELLLQPEVDLPLEYRLELAAGWTMHDRVPSAWYLDPYALGLSVWRYIDRKYGWDESVATVKVSSIKHDKNGVPYETVRQKSVTAVVRNRDKMLEVRRNYDDNRFLTEFLNEELFEYINEQALDWLRRTFRIVNRTLKKHGWDESLILNTLPLSLTGMIRMVEVWMHVRSTAEYHHAEFGTPMFPVSAETLREMGTILQLVAAFDADRHAARKQLVLRTGYHFVPNIKLMDTGKFGDNTWTLVHEWDDNFGPLMQSDCRETLKYFWRLRGTSSPVRLLTRELKTDTRGQEYGDPLPYEYCTQDGDTVKERWL